MKLEFDPKKNITNLDRSMFLTKIHDLLIISKIVKNWQDVLLFRLGLKANIILHLKSGQQIKIKKPEDYYNFWESELGQVSLSQITALNRAIKIDRKNKLVKFKFKSKTLSFYYDSQKQMANNIGMIKEQFISPQYNWLDVKNRTVIDIGANIGDSAIYFALKGAKHVYAFEPYPYSYNLAKKNIKLNKLENQITLLNEGCGGKNKKIKISSVFKNSAGSSLKNFKKGKTINIASLDQITKNLKLNNAILKIDCEGCEYGVILNAEKQSLRKFNQIAIEYHQGYLNLIKKLKDCGFKTKFTIPQCHSTITNKGYFGMIYAKRIVNRN